jgi:hypothetical protein
MSHFRGGKLSMQFAVIFIYNKAAFITQNNFLKYRRGE